MKLFSKLIQKFLKMPREKLVVNLIKAYIAIGIAYLLIMLLWGGLLGFLIGVFSLLRSVVLVGVVYVAVYVGTLAFKHARK
jgi:hypothetical protein